VALHQTVCHRVGNVSSCPGLLHGDPQWDQTCQEEDGSPIDGPVCLVHRDHPDEHHDDRTGQQTDRQRESRYGQTDRPEETKSSTYLFGCFLFAFLDVGEQDEILVGLDRLEQMPVPVNNEGVSGLEFLIGKIVVLDGRTGHEHDGLHPVPPPQSDFT